MTEAKKGFLKLSVFYAIWFAWVVWVVTRIYMEN